MGGCILMGPFEQRIQRDLGIVSCGWKAALECGHAEVFLDVKRRGFEPGQECCALAFSQSAGAVCHEPLRGALRYSGANLLIRCNHALTSISPSVYGNAPEPD